MFIIGHRGAAGIAPENTIPSIEAAVRAGVDMIEFDVQQTKDGQLVIFHDDDLGRLTHTNAKVNDLTFDQINVTSTHSGHPIPSMQEGVEAADGIPILLDLKGKNWSKLLVQELKKYQDVPLAVSSNNLKELIFIKEKAPKVKTYLSELTSPFGAIHTAKTFELTGISLNFWVLNPLAYLYARRSKCDILVYAINRPVFARFVHFLYPHAGIITNVPDKLAKLSNKRRSERPRGKALTRRSRSRRSNTAKH